jgi:hypothetical protein
MKLLLLFISSLLIHCSEKTDFSKFTQHPFGEEGDRQDVFSYKPLNRAVLMQSTPHDSSTGDLIWITGTEDKPKETLVLFNEFYDPISKAPLKRVWYGPDTQKLVEWNDENKDGYFERRIYYNKYAKPSVIDNVIAQAWWDHDKDGVFDLYWFAQRRVERRNTNGTWTLWLQSEVKESTFKQFLKQGDVSLLGEGRTIPAPQSWVETPSLIDTDRAKPVLNPY